MRSQLFAPRLVHAFAVIRGPWSLARGPRPVTWWPLRTGPRCLVPVTWWPWAALPGLSLHARAWWPVFVIR